jgi:hypothetical protein
MNNQIDEWLAKICTEIDHHIYERSLEFWGSLLVILAGEDLILQGVAGSGKSFFASLLSPLASLFQSHIYHAEANACTATLSIQVSPLCLRSSYQKLALASTSASPLSLPSFSFVEAQTLAQTLPFAPNVLDILLDWQADQKINAKQFVAYINVVKASAYYNNRSTVSLADISVLQLFCPNAPRARQQADSGMDAEMSRLEAELETELASQQHLRKLRHFSLVVKGQESATCRFLYQGEESHLLLSSYQQMLIHKERFISIQFYQPSGYGLAARPFKESFRLVDDFTLMDVNGHYYELLSEQVRPLRRLSALSLEYFNAQLDAILQRMFEQTSLPPTAGDNIFMPHSPKPTEGDTEAGLMLRIKAVKEKIFIKRE